MVLGLGAELAHDALAQHVHVATALAAKAAAVRHIPVMPSPVTHGSRTNVFQKDLVPNSLFRYDVLHYEEHNH